MKAAAFPYKEGTIWKNSGEKGKTAGDKGTKDGTANGWRSQLAVSGDLAILFYFSPPTIGPVFIIRHFSWVSIDGRHPFGLVRRCRPLRLSAVSVPRVQLPPVFVSLVPIVGSYPVAVQLVVVDGLNIERTSIGGFSNFVDRPLDDTVPIPSTGCPPYLGKGQIHPFTRVPPPR